LLVAALLVELFDLLDGRAFDFRVFGLLGVRVGFDLPFAPALGLLEAPGFALAGDLGFAFVFPRLALV
jgi:hypothetical protein